jgi:hypothetical protein
MVGQGALTMTPLVQVIYFLLAMMFGYMFFASETYSVCRNSGLNMPYGDPEMIAAFVPPGRIILCLLSIAMFCHAASIIR